MAQTVKLKRSATASAVPTTGQLDLGEIAINTFDGKLFIKKDNGTPSIVEIGAGGGSGTVTSVAVSSANNALSISGSPITSSGTINLTANTFTSIDPGVVPASGGGTTNFLRADGTWAAAGGGGGSVYYKDPVRVATIATGTLASAFQNGSVVDGVTLATGDRILIKNQTTATENGIYTVNASGAPTRATDMDEDSESQRGIIVYVQFGNVNGGSRWQLVSSNATPIVVGTSTQVWGPEQGIMAYGINAWTAPIATGSGSIAIGNGATAGSVIDNVVIGRSATAANVSNGGSVVIGAAASASSGTAGQRVIIGSGAVGHEYCVAIGRNASANSTSGWGIAIGTDSSSSNASTIAIGRGASAFNDQAVAIGRSASAGGFSAIGILNSTAGGNYSLAIGKSAKADNTMSIVLAVGDGSTTITGASRSVAIIPGGTGASDTVGTGSVTIGMGGSSSWRYCGGNNTVNIGWTQGSTQTANSSILISAAGYFGGSTFPGASNNNVMLMTGSSVNFTNVATNNIWIGNGQGTLSLLPGKVCIMGNAGFGTGTSETFYINWHAQITSGAATEMFLNYPTNTNRAVLPNNITWGFKTTIVARQYGGTAGTVGDTAYWELKGVIKRIGTAATTAIVGTVTKTSLGADTNAATWDVSHTADTTNGALLLTVTGETNKNIRWHAKTEIISIQ